MMAREQINIINSDNDTININDGVIFFTVFGRIGFEMAQFNISSVPTWIDGGSQLEAVTVLDGQVTVPIYIYKASSHEDLSDEIRTLAGHVNPIGKSEVTIQRIREDADTRELTCIYNGGMAVMEETGVYARVDMAFTANDPYWYAASATTDTYETGTPATFFPFFPMRLSSSTIFASPVINNTGQVRTWPIWTITGPGIDPVFKNLSTDKTLAINRITTTIGAGETLTIDTRKGIKTIKRNDGVSFFSNKTELSSLWPLEPGNNSVQLELSGTSGASQVAISYTLRNLTA